MDDIEDSKQKEGVKLFLKASELERAGEIGHAMELYGKAYRLDPEVEAHIDFKALLQDNSSSTSITSKKHANEEETVVPFDVDYPNSVALISAALAASPQHNEQPLGLSDDIWLRIMREAGSIHAPNVDVIGRTCRKTYLISRQDQLWRHLFNLANASSSLAPTADLVDDYGDYRRAFLLRPRLRTDGVYINRITYFRSGLSFTSLNNPVHLVTYYRYLRFFNSNSGYGVWWLITSRPPKEVLDQLRAPPQSSGDDPLALDFAALGVGQFANFFYGHYHRINSVDSPEFELRLASPKEPGKIKWRMRVQLDSPKRRRPVRHGTLQCTEYTSVGSVFTPISTADWGPFLFSKVKSYHT